MCFKSILSKINELEKRLSSSIHELHSAFYVCLILRGLLPERKADVEDNAEGYLLFYFWPILAFLPAGLIHVMYAAQPVFFWGLLETPQVWLIILNSFKSSRDETRTKIMTFSFLRRKKFQNPENTMDITESLNFIREKGT